MFKKAKKMESFLLWWLMFSVIGLGTIIFVNLGGIEKIYEVDFTRISFLIFALFSYFTIRTGVLTYTVCKTPSFKFRVSKKAEIAWFFANKLTGLGMIGTVFGFIKMLSVNFVGVDPASVHIVMKAMMSGAGAALYTTAAGLICGMLLQLQLFNLEYHMGKSEESYHEEI